MRIGSASTLRGRVTTPGDKSISHRALMLSALAAGDSTIHGLSHGADVLGTAEIMRQLGAEVTLGTETRVTGPRAGLQASLKTLDCGNSGTTMRLLMGLLAGIAGTHTLDGDASLRSRPMNRVAHPLEMMGMKFSPEADDLRAPFQMISNGQPLGLNYQVPVPSAQVKSAILLAGLAASGPTVVIETTKTRANTEEMLSFAGVPVSVVDQEGQRIIQMSPGRPSRQDWVIPQDPSQAAFFVVAATIHPDADLYFQGIYGGEERNGYLRVLERMGAHIERDETHGLLNLRVRSAELQGTTIHSNEVPSVDEVPILVVAAAAASGVSTFVDMSELRLKESDRFANSVDLARSLGADVAVDRDTFSVTGLGSSRAFAIPFSSHPGDHRMTMATAIAGVCGRGADIEFPESTESSFPDFFQLLTSLSS